MFILIISFVVLQRIIELILAKRNEKWMKKKGGIELGQSHYRYIVLIHILFFVSLIAEVTILEKHISSAWGILFPLFLLTQLGRVWVIKSLGQYWNTKLIILPQSEVVKKGPYRYIKHPNYVIVSLEFIIIPLLFQAYITTVLFSLLNVLILSFRIPAEEKALAEQTEYGDVFSKQRRFVPTISKRV